MRLFCQNSCYFLVSAVFFKFISITNKELGYSVIIQRLSSANQSDIYCISNMYQSQGIKQKISFQFQASSTSCTSFGRFSYRVVFQKCHENRQKRHKKTLESLLNLNSFGSALRAGRQISKISIFYRKCPKMTKYRRGSKPAK